MHAAICNKIHQYLEMHIVPDPVTWENVKKKMKPKPEQYKIYDVPFT